MNIKLHTKIKHRILAYYYGVLKNVIQNFYTWYYVDLFAGDGICRTDIPDHIVPMLKKSDREYSPPFFNLIEYSEKTNGKLDMKFIFNDLELSDKLKEKLPNNKHIIAIGNKDANKYYKEAIDIIKNPEKPSLFYLDPSNHKDLKFSTIKNISEFKSKKKGRKPELIINLMVFTMLEAVKRKDYNSITESIGTDKYLTELEEYNSKGKTHELFLKVFLMQLKKLGYKTTNYLITSTEKKAPMYYLIFCAYKDDIFKIHKSIEPNIKKLQSEDWVKETATIAYQIGKISSDQKTLSSF